MRAGVRLGVHLLRYIGSCGALPLGETEKAGRRGPHLRAAKVGIRSVRGGNEDPIRENETGRMLPL